MTCVLAAAALMTARQPTVEDEGVIAAEPPPPAATVPVPAATVSVPAAKPASSRPPKAVPAPASRADSNGDSNGVSTPAPAPTKAPDGDAAAMKTVSAAGITPEAPLATVTGCLERDDDTFWLKDASGDVPKSRSWKTGFLRKRSPKIALVGGPGPAALSGHVGQRVEATGTLVDRELRARSVRRIAESCR
jgi:outer membrane biosynthesis protein TonB